MAENFDDEDYDEEDEDLAPAPIPLEPVATKRFGKDATPEELIEDDADQHMQILSYLKAGWRKVTNIDELCKMALTHTKVLEMRRKGLLQPTEAPRDSGGGDGRLKVWDG